MAFPRRSFADHSYSPPSRLIALLIPAMPLLVNVVPGEAIPLRHISALFLRVLLDFLPAESAFSTVAPLANAGEAPIVQPVAHNVDVVVAQADHRKLARCPGGNFLAHCKADALALRRLRSQRALALLDLAVKENWNGARLGENQLVDFLLVSLDFAAGRILDLAQTAAGVLEKALDLVVVQKRRAVVQSRENGHGLLGHRIRAERRHLVLYACRIRCVTADKLAVNIRVRGAGTENRLDKR